MTLYEGDLLKRQNFYYSLGEYREEMVSSTLTYKGWAIKGTAESSAAWIIQRVVISGGVTTQQIAPQIGNALSKTSQVWDDRATLFTAPPWGNAFCTSFDGVNDFVNFGDNLNYERNQAFSFSGWFYFNNTTTAMALFSKRSGSGGTPGILFNMLSNGRLEGNLVNTATSNHARRQMTVAILEKTLYHICWTYDGSSAATGLNLYLNGTLITLSSVTNTLSASILTTTDAMAGQFASSQYFSGKMDEITFWDTCLTSNEASEIYNGGVIFDPSTHTKAVNLSHYWQAGDGDAYPTWNDSIGSINGTMTNMVASELTRELP